MRAHYAASTRTRSSVAARALLQQRTAPVGRPCASMSWCCRSHARASSASPSNQARVVPSLKLYPHSFVAFLRNLPLRLVARRPSLFDAPPQTVGEHIKRARLSRRLTQAEAGKIMSVSESTVLNWEKNRREPPVLLMPSVNRFLGYDPYPPPFGYPARLLAKRRTEGWTIQDAARQLGINATTWGLYEAGRTVPRGRLKTAIEILLRGEVRAVSGRPRRPLRIRGPRRRRPGCA